MYLVRYRLYSWSRPKLTLEEEVAVGHEIAIKGKDIFLRQTPYLSAVERQRIENAKKQTVAQKIGVIALAVLFFGPAIIFLGVDWTRFLIVLVPVLIVSIGSLLAAKASYRKWVDEMLAKYAAHVAKNRPAP
jgi:multisubunit Na+/H+ antiporter MnhG subunit